MNRLSALKWIVFGWFLAGPTPGGLLLSPVMAQDQYVEVRNGNVYVQLGASPSYRELIRDLGDLGFNRVLVGAPDSHPDQVEVIQPASPEAGFTLAESTALDMLVSADRNPDRYAGLNPLAIKAILLAGARNETSSLSELGWLAQLDATSGAGMINRRRSLEIFAAGRNVAGSPVENRMGWDRSVGYSGHPDRHFFEIEQDGSWDFAAALVANPEVNQEGIHWVASSGPVAAKLRVSGIEGDGSIANLVAESTGNGRMEYLYLGTLPAGRYVLEVVPLSEGISYGVAWNAQRHGTVLPDGGYDPVFLFRDKIGSGAVEVGSRVQFSGTAFGALDNLVRIEFFADGVRIGESDEPEFDFSWIADQEGVTGIYAVATDRYGNQIFSSVTSVDVSSPEGQGQVVHGPVISNDLSGVYYGEISGGGLNGWVAISVLQSGHASVLGYFESAGFGFFDREGVVSSSGDVVFPAIHYVCDDPLGVIGPTPGHALHGSIRDQGFDGIFVNNETKVSARVSGANGPMTNAVGFYELGVLNRQEGRLLMVVDRDGETRGLVCHGGSLIEIKARLADAEMLSMDLGGGQSLILDLGTGNGQVEGIFNTAGGGQEELLGIRDVAERRDRLANISTRGMVAEGSGVLIAGFVVEGNAPRQVMIRAVGPSLQAFGVRGYATDPHLVVRQSMGVVNSSIAISDNWDGSSGIFRNLAEKVGAFPLSAGQSDAAVILTLEPGVYTAEMSDRGSGGLGLIEVYDADESENPTTDRISNISTRGLVKGGIHSLVGGFVVVGTVPKQILIRAVGPSLSKLGVVGWLEDADLYLDRQVDGEYVPVLENGDWHQNPNLDLIQDASIRVGAFPLEEGSKDAALMVWLRPGAYTATVNTPGRESGIALLEVYEIGDE